MDIANLKQRLEAEGFPADMYSLSGGLPNETYCLEQRGNRWAVYYSERGKRSGEHLFSNESDACEFFLSRLRSDRTSAG